MTAPVEGGFELDGVAWSGLEMRGTNPAGDLRIGQGPGQRGLGEGAAGKVCRNGGGEELEGPGDLGRGGADVALECAIAAAPTGGDFGCDSGHGQGGRAQIKAAGVPAQDERAGGEKAARADQAPDSPLALVDVQAGKVEFTRAAEDGRGEA